MKNQGSIFLTEKECYVIINSLEVSAKQTLDRLTKTPFLLNDILLAIKPERELMKKLQNHIKVLKG